MRRTGFNGVVMVQENALQRQVNAHRDRARNGAREAAPLDWVRRAALLVIDDLGTAGRKDGKPTEAWLAAMEDVIDYRYSKRLPTIITTNLTRAQIAKLYQLRIAGRLDEIADYYEIAQTNWRRQREDKR